MKYKLFFFLCFVCFLLFVYISFLNPHTTKLYLGSGRSYETSIANWVTVAFILGVIVSLMVSFFSDVRRGLQGWRQGKKEKRRGELKELFEKARAFGLKGEPEKALEQFNRLIRTSPDVEEAYSLMADIHIARKEFDKAADVLKMAEANLGRRESILLKHVRVNLALKENEKAEQNLKDILNINEWNLKAMGLLRDCYVRQKRWAEALEIQKKLCKQIRTEDEGRTLTGIRYEQIKELFEKGGDKTFQGVLKELRELTNEDNRFIPGYILSAEVYKLMGRLNDAGRVFGRGYSKTGHIVFLLKMEDLYIDRGEPGVILKIYRRILDLSPRDHLIMFLYARLCLRLEMIDEAMDMLNALFADGEEFRGLHRAMAEAYIHRGEMEKAAGEFRRAFPMDNVYIPFTCEKCQALQEDWNDSCINCHSWNSIGVKKEGLFQAESSDLKMLYEQDWEA